MIFFFFPDSPLFFERVRETREHEKTKEIKNVIVKDKEKFQFRSNKNPRNSKNEIWGVFGNDVICVVTLDYALLCLSTGFLKTQEFSTRKFIKELKIAK